MNDFHLFRIWNNTGTTRWTGYYIVLQYWYKFLEREFIEKSNKRWKPGRGELDSLCSYSRRIVVCFEYLVILTVRIKRFQTIPSDIALADISYGISVCKISIYSFWSFVYRFFKMSKYWYGLLNQNNILMLWIFRVSKEEGNVINVLFFRRSKKKKISFMCNI